MLDKYRKNIDLIDKEILSLLEKRKTLTDEVMDFKLHNSLPVSDPQRESEIIAKLQSCNNTLNPTFIQKLYQLIFEQVRGQISSPSDKLEKQTILAESLPSSANAHTASDTCASLLCQMIKDHALIIAGPCAVESADQINTITQELSTMGVKFLRGGCYKPRTTCSSFQGLEDEGVRLLYNAAQAHKMYTVTEILDALQYERNREFIDIIQIGSRNMASYGLLKNIGKLSANDNKYVMLKRGLSATINEFLNAADYILQAGNEKVILCLRGIRTFEQIDSDMRFTADLASIIEIKEKSKLPVLFDPSHSTGVSKYVCTVARAALNIGADGLMVEVHNNPSAALVDGKQAITPQEFYKGSPLLHINTCPKTRLFGANLQDS